MRILLLFLVASVLFLSSCEKSVNCWGKTVKNDGEIIADTSLCSNCIFMANEDENFVIVTEAALQEIFISNFRNEDQCKLNSFNLDKYSLVGKTMLVNCKYKIRRNFTLDAANKTYTYEIVVDECGNCLEKNYITNWVLVPKIKEDHKVIFKTVRKPIEE